MIHNSTATVRVQNQFWRTVIRARGQRERLSCIAKPPARDPLLLAGLLVGLACSNDSSVAPNGSVPAAISAVSPTVMSGTVGAWADPTPTVRVTDLAGNPVTDTRVVFQAATGDGSVEREFATTDDNGAASAGRWLLGWKAGTQTLSAKVGTLPAVIFTVTALPGPIAKVIPGPENFQVGIAGDVLPLRVSVLVADLAGNPLPGEVVSFQPMRGSGSIETQQASTDSNGIATPGFWTLGDSVGAQKLIAKVDGIETTLTAWAILPGCDGDCIPGQIAFVRQGQIYRMNADGTGLTQLTASGANSDPAWSFDGRRIAFSSDRAGFCCEIYIMDADGANVIRRSQTSPGEFAGTFASQPAWSPDGHKLAFSRVISGHYGIAVISADNNDDSVRFIGHEAGYNAWPAWSPDGRRIAWNSDWVSFDFVYDVYSMNANGSGIEQLTDGNAFGTYLTAGGKDHWQPAWSPDGGTIATVRCPWEFNTCQHSSIAVMNADGSGLRVISDAGGFSRPTWSPDGQRIAFTRSGCLVSIRRDGSDLRSLVCDAESPAWGRSSAQ